MKSSNLLLLAILFIGLCSASCGSKDSNGCSDVEMDQKESELSTAQTLLLDAQLAYANDNSLANCNAVATAWDDYLSKLSSFINCLEGPGLDNWQTIYAIQAEERNNFTC